MTPRASFWLTACAVILSIIGAIYAVLLAWGHRSELSDASSWAVVHCQLLPPAFWYSLLAASVGIITAIAELLPRYRDEPFRAAFSPPGRLYLGLNAAVSVIAFAALYRLQPSENRALLLDALGGGLGGVIILRTTVVLPKSGGASTQIGPGNIITAFQNTIDRQIDRVRAIRRSRLIKQVMGKIDFDKATPYVLTMVTASMQNLSVEEQEQFGRKVGEIAAGQQIGPAEKSYALGFAVLDKLGETGLRRMFDESDSTYDRISPTPSTAPVAGAAPVAAEPAILPAAVVVIPASLV